MQTEGSPAGRSAGRASDHESSASLSALFPESRAGGFSSIDGLVQFFTRVRAVLEPDMTVVDFGAGRGEAAEDPVPFRRDLRCLRGSVRCVIGIDVDEAVLHNPLVDQPIVVENDERLPLNDASVDLILSISTFEHIDDPAHVAGELDRILRPGGWICAMTPNAWGYIALGARMIPNRLHEAVLRRLQPGRHEHDVFPTRYRMNTVGRLKRLFPESRYEHCSYAWSSEPAYFGDSAVAQRIVLGVFRFLPARLGATWLIFLRKRG